MLQTPRPISVVKQLRTHAVILGSTVAVIWAVFIVDSILGGALLRYGVVPRTVDGLGGILLAPFLHANFNHIAANTVPLLVLGWLVMLRDPRHFLLVALTATITGGAVAWLLGPTNSVHIGASGVVFGFLLFAGWYARSFASIMLSLAVVAFWGGLVLGVLPGEAGISWQEHLGGFIGGALAARWFARDPGRAARLVRL